MCVYFWLGVCKAGIKMIKFDNWGIDCPQDCFTREWSHPVKYDKPIIIFGYYFIQV